MKHRDPLPSTLRTPEQMQWVHDRFTIDGLARLAQSTPDYYEQKGYYLPDVAALAHAALEALESVTRAIAFAGPLVSVDGETKMPRESWLAIEGAVLAVGVQTPPIEVHVAEDVLL